MFSHRRNGSVDRAVEYASAGDFCRIFHEDMSGLYWLALTLTADEAKAEQCFVTSLEECIDRNSVFKDWARSWSRRVVIKNAIRRASPLAVTPNGPSANVVTETIPSTDRALDALRSLRPLDRFVFVISVLEGYADRDCATLLGCSSAEVVKARRRALLQLRREIDPWGTLPGLPRDESPSFGISKAAEAA
jgi:DNA-directed RNA polymerase specialized sigma24 family protein